MFQPTLHTYLWLSPLSVGGLSQFHTIIQYRKAHPTVVKALMSFGQVFFLVGAEPLIRKQTRQTVSGREKTAVLTYKLETARSFSIAGGDSRFLILIRSVLVAFTSTYPNLPNHQFAFAKRERE